MIEVLQFFQYGGYSYDIGSLMQQLEAFGLFDYVLPFLLIFALVYGILEKSHVLGKNKGVNIIVGIAVGLMALSFGDVPKFFAIILPKAGIGLSILLVALLLGATFVPMGEGEWGSRIFFIIGALLFFYILFSSINEFSYLSNNWLAQYWPGIFVLILVIIVVVLISIGKEEK